MKKILVVDDTKNIRTLLTTCLKVNGYDVSVANNGYEALELLKNERFDLAFLDIKMPEISGTEVLRRMREMGIAIPVVIMTAFATVKNAVECTKLGAVAYLQKPFTADKVKNVLHELLKTLSSEEDELHHCLRLSQELIDKSKLEDAFRLLKKALSIDPTHKEIYVLMGNIYEKQDNHTEATRFYMIAHQFDR